MLDEYKEFDDFVEYDGDETRSQKDETASQTSSSPKKERLDKNKPDSEKPKNSIAKYIIYFLIILITTLAVLYFIKYNQPQLYNRLTNKIDFLNLSKSSDYQLRMDNIDLLDIDIKKRELLKNGQIFNGATKQMVFLALGKADNISPNHGMNTEYWVYENINSSGNKLVIEFNGIGDYNGVVVNGQQR